MKERYVPGTISDISSLHLASVPDFHTSIRGAARKQTGVRYRDQSVHRSSVLVEMRDRNSAWPPILRQWRGTFRSILVISRTACHMSSHCTANVQSSFYQCRRRRYWPSASLSAPPRVAPASGTSTAVLPADKARTYLQSASTLSIDISNKSNDIRPCCFSIVCTIHVTYIVCKTVRESNARS